VFTWDVTIGALRSYSRTITLFPGPEVIHAELRGPLSQHPNLFLDGEFYADGIKLQDINSVVRRLTGSTQYDSLITYRVYDCFVANGDEITPEPFSQRLTRLNEFFAANPQLTRVRPVPQTPVTTEAEATALYTKYLAEGYEGAMIRLDTPYESRPNNYHSKTLLKMKPTLDAEFELIGWETAQKGRAADALMLVCVAVAPDGTRREFRVTPAMPLAERVELAARMPEEFDTKWRGKFITVQFASWSKDHVPQQPRTLMQTRVD
jgi:ATP-dependent DNA ligase